MDEQLFKLFDEGAQREGTECEKWDSRGEVFGRDDVIPLWVADMDFPSPPAVREALVARAQQGVYGYTQSPVRNRKAVADWMKKRHGADVQTDWILSSPGVVDSLREALKIFTQPGDGVVVQPPVYGPFYHVTEQVGCKILRNRLIETGDGWKMDFEDLERHFAAGAKVMMLCSPHNPTGRIWTRDELERVVALCNQYHVALVCDEIHADFEMPGNHHTSMVTLEGAERAVVCISATKTFNLAGLRNSSMLIRDEDVRRDMKKQLTLDGLNGENLFGMIAQRTAYEQGEEWLNGLIEYLDGNMRYVEGFIREHMPEIKLHRPQGTYLMWLDMRALNMNQEELGRFMVEKAGIGFSGGTGFGDEGQGFMRLNAAIPRRYLVRAMEQLERALHN
jgi:cystathionine beta-lyase